MTEQNTDYARVPRRRFIAATTDALMAWWQAGIEDEDMREWWTTPDGLETAHETAHVIWQRIEERGWFLAAHIDGSVS